MTGMTMPGGGGESLPILPGITRGNNNMAIDPLAPGKLFAQIFAARQAREAERTNLLTQLEAHHHEAAAEREQQRLQREQQGQQFMQSLGLQQKQVDLAEAHQRFTEQEAARASLDTGAAELPEWEFGPAGLAPKGAPGELQQVGGILLRRVPLAERRQRELVHAREVNKIPAQTQLWASEQIAKQFGPEAGRAHAVGFADNPNPVTVAREYARLRHDGDPEAQWKDIVEFTKHMSASAENPLAIAQAGAIRNTLDTELAATVAGTWGAAVVSRLKAKLKPEELEELRYDPDKYQTLFEQQLESDIRNNRIPAQAVINGRLRTTGEPIREYFQQRVLPTAIKFARPPAENPMQTFERIADKDTQRKAGAGQTVTTTRQKPNIIEEIR